MSKSIAIIVPDIGDFDAVSVIEVLVAPGDSVEAEQPLITLESDKATMDIPAPEAGVIESLTVKVGDSVAKDTQIGSMTSQSHNASETPTTQDAATGVNESPAPTPVTDSQLIDIIVPDIGDFDAVDVIDVVANVGDSVAKEDAIITLESDKATMDIPAPQDGTIATITIAVGDKVQQGTVIGQLSVTSAGAPVATQPEAAEPPVSPPATASASAPERNTQQMVASAPPSTLPDSIEKTEIPHASPGVRRYARELGADLHQIKGSGSKGRITKDDVTTWVKQQLASGTATQAAASGMGIPPIPAVDFSEFGEIETVPLSRIKKISGPFLQRAWLNIPHVTHHDEADVTDMEAFRKAIKAEAEQQGVKVTPLAFITKALIKALQQFPNFNASLAPDGASLIVKHYYHIGIAVDTPGGLMVPVIKDADKLSVFELAAAMANLGKRARDGKIKPDELKGGTISISSLGGIGGSAFTPIVNAPEVAILGLTRSKMTPVWDGSEFKPRLILPMDLSYDHRVIDGAEAARFMRYLSDCISDIRRLTL